jgi:DNA-binding transcriptional LysR family regulator
MDQLRGMAVFVQVVDLGGISAAAEREQLSPTMVGNHLRALEERLGARLLNRTTRRQSLTESGAIYYEQCRTILRLVADANGGVQASQTAPSGRLRIAAPLSFGSEQLTPAVGEFLAVHPAVSVELTLNDRVMDLVEEGFDAAIRVGKLAESGLVARPLRPYRMWICGSPAYLRARGTPLTPDDLAGHDCLVFSHAGRRWRFDDAAGGAAEQRTVPGRFTVNSGQALRVAALAGLGIIMQPEVLLEEDVRLGRLVRLFADNDLPSRAMNLVYLRDRQMPPKLAAFRDFILRRFG